MHARSTFQPTQVISTASWKFPKKVRLINNQVCSACRRLWECETYTRVYRGLTHFAQTQEYSNNVITSQPSHLVCQKYVRKHKVAVKMRMTVLKMCIVNRNVTEMFVNCGSRNARWAVYKVEIISLAFKWLIVLRSAIKARDQTHRVLKNAYAAS